MREFYLILGGFCFFYYFIIISYAGIKVAFSPVWIGMAVGCFLMAMLPTKFMIGVDIISFLVFFCFFGVEILLLKNGRKRPRKNADYVIVLGAKVNGVIPSKTLRARVKSASLYLKENKNTKVIVSGGQGKGEDISEALAMKKMLLDDGIERERILIEDQSVNTEQNIRFSKRLIEHEKRSIERLSIVIATSDFHMYRGIALAKKHGIKKVSGCPAKPDQVLALHYYVREFFAVVKDKMVNHI